MTKAGQDPYRKSKEHVIAALDLDTMDEALGVAYEQSQAAAQVAQGRYDRGLENIITLLEARRRAISAESRWWAARRRRCWRARETPSM